MLPAGRIGENGGEEGIVRECGQRVGKGAKKGRGSKKGGVGEANAAVGGTEEKLKGGAVADVRSGIGEGGGGNAETSGEGKVGEAAKVVGKAESRKLGVGRWKCNWRKRQADVGGGGRWEVAKKVGELGRRAKAEGEDEDTKQRVE